MQVYSDFDKTLVIVNGNKMIYVLNNEEDKIFEVSLTPSGGHAFLFQTEIKNRESVSLVGNEMLEYAQKAMWFDTQKFYMLPTWCMDAIISTRKERGQDGTSTN